MMNKKELIWNLRSIISAKMLLEYVYTNTIQFTRYSPLESVLESSIELSHFSLSNDLP